MLRCVKPSFWIEYFHRQTEPVRSSLDKSHHPIHCHFQGLDINPQKGLWIPREKEEKLWGILASWRNFAVTRLLCQTKTSKGCMSTDEKIKSCYNGTLLFYLSGGFLMLFGSEDFLPDGMPVMFPPRNGHFPTPRFGHFPTPKNGHFSTKTP